MWDGQSVCPFQPSQREGIAGHYVVCLKSQLCAAQPESCVRFLPSAVVCCNSVQYQMDGRENQAPLRSQLFFGYLYAKVTGMFTAMFDVVGSVLEPFVGCGVKHLVQPISEMGVLLW